jgi:hypothetical protein
MGQPLGDDKGDINAKYYLGYNIGRGMGKL